MSKSTSKQSGRELSAGAAADAHPAMAAMAGMNQALQAWGPLGEYMTDAVQRTILFWDVLRQRSDQYYAQKAKAVPHVLSFDAELVLDARTFKKPVNYLLVRIKPPPGVVIDPLKRPFVVVDPRAGHGPGIGGFKADSEIGVAMRAGHPCYFVGFTPEPMPGQTIEDIMHAEAAFLEKVIALHPKAEGKPCVIGNCQAGWAVMMVAAMRPELFGPIIIPGSPLSYWAGVEGENPMRYTGGLAGGSWMTALTSDLGNGKFDGGYLVENFENLNPANTLWTKNYDLWSKVDTEGKRFLEFEKWWGGHVNLNAEEIQWIVDQLFVGNRLATGEIVTSDGERIDLRNIRSPIICFCSKGDNITPPQQALGWIVDLYGKRRRHPRLRPDHRLRRPRQRRPPRHLRLGRRRQEGAPGVRLQHRPDRRAAARPVRGRDDAQDRRHGQSGAGHRRLDRALRAAHAGRRARHRAARARRTNAASPPCGGCRRSTSACIARCSSPSSRRRSTSRAPNGCSKLNHAELPFEIFSERNPLMQQVAQLAEQVREQRQPASPDNPLPAVAGHGLGPDHRRARRLSRPARAQHRSRSSWRSTARRCCRRWSA